MSVTIPLSGGRGHALVSTQDVSRVKNLPWHLVNGYAATHLRRTTVYMHRLVIQAPAGYVVDHRNHDPLDNRRENLRVARQSQNMANVRPYADKTSRHKGVWWDQERQVWRARVKQNRRHIYLGSYENEDDAGKAYDSAALTLFGEFAYPNFLDSTAKPLDLIVIEARSRISERPPSGYFGVQWHKGKRRFIGRVTINGERLVVASTHSALEAALAVDRAIHEAIKRGDKTSGFSRLNFLDTYT